MTLKLKLNLFLAVITLSSVRLQPATAADTEAWLKCDLIHPEVIIKHGAELNLSAEQQGKLKEIIDPAKAKVQPMEAAVKEAQSALETALRNHATTLGEAGAQLTKVLETEAVLKQFQLRTLLELRTILTPEQQKQALALAVKKAVPGLEAKVRAEAERLKFAFESLGLPLTDGLKKRGHQIEQMLKDGGMEQAMKALEKLADEAGLDDPISKDPLDVSKLSAGETDLTKLKARLDAVEAKAKEVISVEVISKLLQARAAMEKAKQDADADLAGKILTFAEALLEKK
jgi:Spy/CpxP family protein refolding chaperone